MHHTRRTHNAHNETQRRLKKVLQNSRHSSYRTFPRYTYAKYLDDGRLLFVYPHWVVSGSSWIVNRKSGGYGIGFNTFEEVEYYKKHDFLYKDSKSSGSKSNYRFFKRQMHRLWRRRGIDEGGYTIKGTTCSKMDLF